MHKPKSVEDLLRWAFEGAGGDVADVADGGPAFGRAVVGAGGDVGEALEKIGGLVEFGCGRFFGDDGIADSGLLLGAKIGEVFLKSRLRFGVDPILTKFRYVTALGLA